MQEVVRFLMIQVSFFFDPVELKLFAFEVLQPGRRIGAQCSTPSDLFESKVS